MNIESDTVELFIDGTAENETRADASYPHQRIGLRLSLSSARLGVFQSRSNDASHALPGPEGFLAELFVQVIRQKIVVRFTPTS
jgi:hypothetical protein